MNIKHYLKNYKLALVSYLGLMIFQSVFEIALTIMFANSISEVVIGNYHVGMIYLIVALILTIFNKLCSYFSYKIFYKYSSIIKYEISYDLINNLFALSSSVYSENNTGAFVQKILQDPKDLLEQYSNMVDWLLVIIESVSILFYIVYLNWIIGLLYIGIIIVLFFIEKNGQKIRKQEGEKNKEVNDINNSFVTEIVKSEKDIKTLNLQNNLRNITTHNLNSLQKSDYKYNMTECCMWTIRNTIINVFSVLMLLLSIIFLKQDLMVTSVFILIFSYKSNIHEFVYCAGNMAQAFTDIKISHKRIFDLYDKNKYKIEEFGKSNIDKLCGNIKFSNVKFSYKTIEENDEGNEILTSNLVLNDISFDIKQNQCVAFVGKSGCGKSTIASLIAKMYTADSGVISIDNKNINKLSKDTIRNNVTYINQFPYIFDMSIKDNLLLINNKLTEKQIWEALEIADLKDEVLLMPKKLNTKLGENGVKLSGGQKQRLAIARAILKDSPIIIFDESTSSLDNVSQNKIIENIHSLNHNHTIIFIAHRLSTIKNVDNILYIKDGKITSSGNFKELYATNDEFKNMFDIENLNDKNNE